MIKNIIALINNKYFTFLLFSVVFFFVLFLNINYVGIGDGAEFRAEIAREMMAENNYLIPTLGGQYKLTKPPIYYDYLMLFYKTLGGPSLWTARFSSMIASFLIILLLFIYIKRYLKLDHPYLFAFLLLFQPLYFYYSRRVELDIFLTLEILTMFMALKLYMDLNIRWLKIFAWIILAITFFTKGPIIFLFAGSTLLFYFIFNGKEKTIDIIKKLWDPWGFLLCISIFMAFFVYYWGIRDIYLKTGIHDIDKRFPLATYLRKPWLLLFNFFIKNVVQVLFYLFPTSLFIPFALKIKDKNYQIIKIITLGILFSFLPFSEIHNNYFVPLIPFLCLLIVKAYEEEPKIYSNKRGRLKNKMTEIHFGKSIVTDILQWLSFLIIIILNLIFFILSKIYGSFVFYTFLMFSILYVHLIFTKKKKLLSYVIVLGILNIATVIFIYPLDISNEKLSFYQQVKQDFAVESSTKLYAITRTRASAAFPLQKKAIFIKNKPDFIPILKKEKEAFVIIGRPTVWNFLINHPDIVVVKKKQFTSHIEKNLYPKIKLDKIPFIKLRNQFLVFALLKSRETL